MPRDREQIRIEFEAWARRELHLLPEDFVRENNGDDYDADHTQSYWDGFLNGWMHAEAFAC